MGFGGRGSDWDGSRGLARMLASSGTGMVAVGGVSASGATGLWTTLAVAGTGAAVAEGVGWRGDEVHGGGGRRRGGTVVRT